jgi:mRNA-degrading endonuclease RelE of RelBE toxin-antitoxin system
LRNSRAPKYKVIAHRRVQKFISNLKDENFKDRIKDYMAKLNYPITLREMDFEKVKGLDKTFRIRIGEYRICAHKCLLICFRLVFVFGAFFWVFSM